MLWATPSNCYTPFTATPPCLHADDQRVPDTLRHPVECVLRGRVERLLGSKAEVRPHVLLRPHGRCALAQVAEAVGARRAPPGGLARPARVRRSEHGDGQSTGRVAAGGGVEGVGRVGRVVVGEGRELPVARRRDRDGREHLRPVGKHACNRMWWGLQPHVAEAATVCVRGAVSAPEALTASAGLRAWVDIVASAARMSTPCTRPSSVGCSASRERGHGSSAPRKIRSCPMSAPGWGWG